ncbi:MAG: hypothetical protein KDA28_10295, partial [Phycisphaerales bacterium]|nr:hypothetical protein [Phycisphaerales bacterium]
MTWTSTDPRDPPSRPGLVRLDAADGRPVLIGATADMRRFVRARLERGLAEVVTTCRHQPVGSSFEADCLYLDAAREALPHACRAVADRRRAWVVQLDAEAPTPFWRKRGLHEFASPPPGVLLGPIADKDSAGRFGEALDSVFDLCRFPN